MNAVVERAKNDKSEAPRLSRLERLRKAKGEDHQPEMPEVDAGYLLGYLWEIGPTIAAGGYPGVITHEELLAWQELTGIELEPWEVRFIRRLSGEYLSMSHKAEKADCPEPLREQADYVPDLSAVAKSLQESLKELTRL